jgi:purine-binding chemotaxis protein CheW
MSSNDIEREKINYPWLVFELGESLYTVNSKIVSTIVIVPEHITKVPKVPKYMKGLIHLRGSVIPLFDLRILFNMDVSKDESKEMVVVLEKDSSSIGILVDKVISVENIERFEETEEIIKMCRDKFVSGVAKSQKNNGMLLILDDEKLMNMTDIAV